MMELKHAPIPSLRGCWVGMRDLFAPNRKSGAVPAARQAGVPPRQWGAADCPELLLGECESNCALLPLLEDREA